MEETGRDQSERQSVIGNLLLNHFHFPFCLKGEMIPILLTESQGAELVLKVHEGLFKSTCSLLQKQCLAEAEDDAVENKREVGWRAHSSTRHCPAVHAIPKPRGWSCQQGALCPFAHTSWSGCYCTTSPEVPHGCIWAGAQLRAIFRL